MNHFLSDFDEIRCAGSSSSESSLENVKQHHKVHDGKPEERQLKLRNVDKDGASSTVLSSLRQRRPSIIANSSGSNVINRRTRYSMSGGNSPVVRVRKFSEHVPSLADVDSSSPDGILPYEDRMTMVEHIPELHSFDSSRMRDGCLVDASTLSHSPSIVVPVVDSPNRDELSVLMTSNNKTLITEGPATPSEQSSYKSTLSDLAAKQAVQTTVPPSLISSTSSSPDLDFIKPECVIVHGTGNLTIFGLSNKFSVPAFPLALHSRLAPEQFKLTLDKVNRVVGRHLRLSLKWLLLGSLCCGCTFGCSMWPVICLSKRTRLVIRKLLNWENERLYRSLGLEWALVRRGCDNSHLYEYVLKIEQLPRINLHQPD